MRFLMAMIVVGCSGDSTLTQSSIGGRASGAGASSTGDPATGEASGGGGAGEGEGEGGPAEGEGEGAVAPGEGEGEAAAPPAEGEGEGAVAPPGGPACVRREREAEDVCAQPCAPGCPEGQACLTFPAGKLCLPAGDRLDGAVCTSPTDCEGGLCIWSGGGPAHCSSECPSLGAGADAVCGDERSCRPSLTPAGAHHCYATGDLPMGEACLRREGRCEGGYCLGAGQAAYCTAWCDPSERDACPAGWVCRPYGEGHLCCDHQRTEGGC